MWKPGNDSANGGVAVASQPKNQNKPAASPAPATSFSLPALQLETEREGVLSGSFVIKGEISGSGSLRIDGQFEGDINLAGSVVTIGRNGVVTADIYAREVVIGGKVSGAVTASERVEIRNQGSLVGDVVAQRISIDDGGYLKGFVDMRPADQRDAKSGGKMEPLPAARKNAHAAHA